MIFGTILAPVPNLSASSLSTKVRFTVGNLTFKFSSVSPLTGQYFCIKNELANAHVVFIQKYCPVNGLTTEGLH